jgi:rhamnulokinase
MSSYLAVDLGAESGRVMLGSLASGRLTLEQIHRFPNIPVRLPTGLYWDTLRLWREILDGMAIAGRQRGLRPAGVGVDTWGVDFALLSADGALADNPRHYRDARNNGMIEAAFERISREKIYEATGLQFMQFNTLLQWYALQRSQSPALTTAQTLLFMPDLFAYLLSGECRAELTIASTSQFYDPREKAWALPVLSALGLNGKLLPRIVLPGTRLGTLLPYVAEETGLPASTPVYATAGHDTAAAVAAVPARQGEGAWCYISSGTWSLMGVELDHPVINAQSMALNFTNEIGVEGRVRLLKNIAGLWPLQEYRRQREQQGQALSYDEIVRMAAGAPPFQSLINPDAFLEPGHMADRIAAYCRDNAQRPPETPGEFARCILESLALRYRQVIEHLEELTGPGIGTIHISGGGSRNQLLNQFTADATGRRVVAGPTEATAAGNLLVQAMGGGELAGLDEIRAVVRDSFPVAGFTPGSRAGWDAAYARFCSLASA